MGDSLEQQESEKQQSGFLASPQIFERMLTWLARLVRLTEEERREAGIFVGHQRDE